MCAHRPFDEHTAALSAKYYRRAARPIIPWSHPIPSSLGPAPPIIPWLTLPTIPCRYYRRADAAIEKKAGVGYFS